VPGRERWCGVPFVAMRARRAEAEDGRRWVVRPQWTRRESLWSRRRRRPAGEGAWTTFRKRLRRTGGRAMETGDALDAGCVVGELAELPAVGVVFLAVALVVIAVALVAFGVVVLVPLLLAVLDLLLLGIVAALGLVGRLVLRRPWTIEARSDDGTVLTWNVVGWRASRERRDEVAALLASGVVPPDATLTLPPTSAPGPAGAPTPGGATAGSPGHPSPPAPSADPG
jgi:hypothetical protein